MPSGTVEEAPTIEAPTGEAAAPKPSGAVDEAPATQVSAEQAAPPQPTETGDEAPAGDAQAPEEAAPEVEDRSPAIDDAALDAIFRAARSHDKFRDEPVSDETLRSLYELLKWGPTSANCSPARFLFLRSPDARERLRPALSPGNRDKTMAAPVTVIVAYDPKFYDRLAELYPSVHDARSWFAGNEQFATETAFRNGTLQGAYLIIAARALGLDCGPMSGFDKAKVDEEFFAYRGWKSNFLCNLGHGDPGALTPRLPRIAFDEACEIL